MDKRVGASWVVLEFAAAYLEDQRTSQVRRLRDYLAAFPGDAEGVAAEYARLEVVSKPSESPANAGEDLILERARSRRLAGRYRLDRELGRGGQARVYLAQDLELGRPIAIKIINSSSGAQTTKDLERLRREASILSGLSHPGICSIHDVGFDDGCAFITMRYVEGRTLSEVLRELRSQGVIGATDLPPSEALFSGASSPERARRIVAFFVKVLEALEVAHASGVVHRDVKPGNIMVSERGDPVLLDFGMASVEMSSLASSTVSEEQGGTPAYVSPEQIDSGRGPVDARSDVYSLGITLYECLTHKRPIEAVSRADLFRAILTQDAAPASTKDSTIDRDLDAVILLAIDRDQNRRYASAEMFRRDLERWMRREPVVARCPSLWLRLRRRFQRHPIAATTLSVLALAIISATVLVTSLYVAARRSKVEAQQRLLDLQADAALQSATSLESIRLGVSGKLSDVASAQAVERMRALTAAGKASDQNIRELGQAELHLGGALRSHQNGQEEAARRYLRESLRRTEELRRRGRVIPADLIRDVEAHRELANLAMLDRDYKTAAVEFQAGRAALEALSGNGSDDVAIKRLKSRQCESEGGLAIAEKRSQDALKLFEESLLIQKSELARAPYDAKVLMDGVSAYLRVGNHRKNLGLAENLDTEIAVPAEQLAYRLLALAPRDANSWFILGNTMVLRSFTPLMAKRASEGLTWSRRAIEAFELALAITPEDMGFRVRLQGAYTSQAALHRVTKNSIGDQFASRRAKEIGAHREGAPLEERELIARDWMKGSEARPEHALSLLIKSRLDVKESDPLTALWLDLLIVEVTLQAGALEFADQQLGEVKARCTEELLSQTPNGATATLRERIAEVAELIATVRAR